MFPDQFAVHSEEIESQVPGHKKPPSARARAIDQWTGQGSTGAHPRIVPGSLQRINRTARSRQNGSVFVGKRDEQQGDGYKFIDEGGREVERQMQNSGGG